MSRVNNVLREISQFNTYEKSEVLEFLRTVLLSSDVSNSVNGEIAENIFIKEKCCPYCNHSKVSKNGIYRGVTFLVQME